MIAKASINEIPKIIIVRRSLIFSGFLPAAFMAAAATMPAPIAAKAAGAAYAREKASDSILLLSPYYYLVYFYELSRPKANLLSAGE